MMFKNVQQGPVDPMFDLKKLADNDTSPEKVDLGVGIYRNEYGQYHEMEAIKEYESTTGNSQFLEHAAEMMFGEKCETLSSGRITSVQTISGTGANHLAALFLKRCSAFESHSVYLGTPTWGNYEPLCSLVGIEILKYPYFDPESGTVNFDILLEMVSQAPSQSVFILQACCQNPLGFDLTQAQWQELANAMKKANVFPFFDIAYQGLGGSQDEDAYAIRLFTEMGFEMVVCQSFSKNFGLYGERCGVLHVICLTAAIAANVYDQLRCLIRWEFASSPAYGSRLVNIIMETPRLRQLWVSELSVMRSRIFNNRQELFKLLKDVPGDWNMILATKGLFW
ncbi:hypothetical protein N7467_005725 [Penicillium canescens]|nr:hypothetical protein N7467_005725 [Penicillium canescens]